MKRLCILLLFIMGAVACGDDDGGSSSNIDCNARTYTYEADAKAIIDKSCAYSGCHDDQLGGAPHDYNSYQGLLIVLDKGDFNTRVIQTRSMPNRDSVPDGKPKTLTDDEIAILDCWVKDGYPEK